jgi:hypothetical protein
MKEVPYKNTLSEVKFEFHHPRVMNDKKYLWWLITWHGVCIRYGVRLQAKFLPI